MASHDSALKKHRQDLKRRLRNRQHRSRLRTQIKRIRQMIASGNGDSATNMLPATLSLIDHTAKLGVIHSNAAARAKSRITRAVRGLGQGKKD